VYGDYTFPDTEKEKKEFNELLQQANCNLGMTLMKLKAKKNNTSVNGNSIEGAS
jgi:hypothetical protein